MKGHKCDHCGKAWRCSIRDCKLDDHTPCGDCYSHIIAQPNYANKTGKVKPPIRAN